MSVYTSVAEAVDGINDGTTLLVGGFGPVGTPCALIKGLQDKGVKDLTIISNNCGEADFGLGILLKTRQIKKVICSYLGGHPEFERQFLAGEVEVELVPQGTIAERVRAGGAGIPAFYTRAGAGTIIAEGRETRVFDGKEYLLETGLRAEFSLVKAYKGDRLGNLIYRRTAMNFNPMMAAAGITTIAEVEELVDIGELVPEQIHTPSIYVQRIIECRPS
jgi:3-oxoacid CoA-transferase subunit A